MSESEAWLEFEYIKDKGREEWRELYDVQLFRITDEHIEGWVYGNQDIKTPFGPSCFIVEFQTNVRLGEFEGTAAACSSGDVFFFFGAEGRNYLIIISENGLTWYT
jgi:hypothetical protein